jgi:hypothetical protein
MAVTTRVLAALGIAAACSLVATGAATPRFYDDDPLWREPASQDASSMKRYEPNLLYDVVENLFTRPGDRARDVRAKNVNSVDEVPDGAWFANRAGRRPLTPDEVARGANLTEGPARGPWTIVGSKSDGVTPGFTIRDTAGDLWFIKFDPPGFSGMATGTEVAVSKLFWALGYHTVEYHVIGLDPKNLVVGEGASITKPGGKKRDMRPDDVAELLATVDRRADGTYRVSASRAAEGTPIGRIRFYGTRSDDPNDLVPHEHRRELRGYGVFAAWFNHVDSKSTNSIDTLVSENGRSYVRHYLLDFGSTLGSGAVGPREYWEGYETLVEDRGEIGKRLVSFGFYIPEWRRTRFHTSNAIGRLPADNTKWNPETWSPRVPNPAFLRARADDRFWAARKALAITDDLIRAAVTEGRFEDGAASQFVAGAIIDRRNAILRHYLPAVNPVVDPALDGAGVLTFGNAAVEAGVAPAPKGYTTTWERYDNGTGEAAALGTATAATTRVPAPGALPSERGAFVQVGIAADGSTHASWATPVTAWFRRADDGWRLVGFERTP